MAFFRAMDGALLAPDIRALGDMDEDDGLSALGPDALDLPPAMTGARRRGALARLVQAWREAQGAEPLPPASLLNAADQLCILIDQASMAGGVDWSDLRALSEELAPHLAEHWRVSADFLEIVMKAWPAFLQENGASESQARRLEAAQALSARWSARPPERPVVIAGSTGAGASTRALMKAVVRLPKGAVILAGLDPDLTPDGWAAVADAPSHPQHVLGQTLKHLNVPPASVRKWPDGIETEDQRARRRLIYEALAPAEATSGWNERLAHLATPGSARDLVRNGLKGLCLIEAEDENEEALVAALLLRETLESKNKTAAIVTPEASLSRRVSAILERWGVEAGPSAGIPLQRTLSGSFLLLLIRWALDPSEPVRLLALLKHPCCRLGRSEADLAAQVSLLEREALRGPRRDRTLDYLLERLEAGKERLWEAQRLVRDLSAVWAPHGDVFETEAIDGKAAAEAIAHMAEQLNGGQAVWSGRQGAMAVQFLEQLAQLSETLGDIEASAFSGFAEAAMARMTAPPEKPEHPRIVIWGPLEARLQRRDRIILASLNEGSWPEPAAADPFLNRTLRRRLGLPDPDERLGLSAHDFAQMANAPEVILLRAKRVDDKPAVASRWLWRLRTLAGGGLGREEAEAAMRPAPTANPLQWARALRHADKVKAAKPPTPRPPVEARALRKFSPSRVVTLIRDPYADYARRILRLEPLRRVAEEIDALERGTAVHAAVEALELRRDTRPLEQLIVDKLLSVGAAPELIELEKPLWLRAAKAYERWLDQRSGHRMRVEVEKEAFITFAASIGEVKLSAKADRIEQLSDGTLAIVDFKTGAPKTAPQVERGLEPQLPLEAAIAARAPFGRIGPAQTSQLIYFRLSLSPATMKESNGAPLSFEKSAMLVAESALDGLKRLIEQYANPKQPYFSKPRVEFAWSVSDYDRLARRAEWATDEGGEE